MGLFDNLKKSGSALTRKPNGACFCGQFLAQDVLG